MLILGKQRYHPMGGTVTRVLEHRPNQMMISTKNNMGIDRKGLMQDLGFEPLDERRGSTIPFEANAGKTVFTRHLIEAGVDPDHIKLPKNTSYDTKADGDTFVELSMEEGWTSAVIMTQPHQLLRAMLGMVRSMETYNYWMNVYTIAPTDTPWQEIVKGSQGMEAKPRFEHIKDEFDRIPIYQKKGDLCSFPELFRYLELRERGLLRLGNIGAVPQLLDLQPDRLLVNFNSM